MAKRTSVSCLGVAWLLIGGLVLCHCANTHSPNEAHKGSSDMNQGSRPEATTYAHAQSLFRQGQYDQVRTLVTPLMASSDADMASRATELHRESDIRLAIREEFPLSQAVLSESKVIGDSSYVQVERGVVRSISMVKTGNTHMCEEILLHNPTEDKVKPDFHVIIMNRDGVIIFTHAENWLLQTIGPHESHRVRVRESMEFPRSLAFSKWALLGWDIAPAYALCAGSKTSYDQLRDDLQREARRLRTSISESLDFPYEIRELVPEVQPFSFDTPIPVSGSQIVDSVTFSRFSRSGVRIRYLNRSTMRIKPDITGYVFNSDGVIIGSFRDSWTFSSLAPGERKEVDVSLRLQVPDALVFSRWAKCAYDEEPAWVWIAGSSKQFDELVNRTESRIRELNASSFLKR